MEMTGRLTNNAAVKQTKTGKELVSFSIAMNDSYRAKGSSKATKIVTYVDCAYWRSTAVAPLLTKGTIVTLSGRIGVNAWKNAEGEARGQITCNVNEIKLQGGGAKSVAVVTANDTGTATTGAAAYKDDLPF